MNASVTDERARVEAELIVELRNVSLDDLVWLLENVTWVVTDAKRSQQEMADEYLRSREG